MNWNVKQGSKSNMLTMNDELVLENSSSAAVYTLPDVIIYLKVRKDLNIRRDRFFKWTLDLS